MTCGGTFYGLCGESQQLFIKFVFSDKEIEHVLLMSEFYICHFCQ